MKRGRKRKWLRIDVDIKREEVYINGGRATNAKEAYLLLGLNDDIIKAQEQNKLRKNR